MLSNRCSTSEQVVPHMVELDSILRSNFRLDVLLQLSTGFPRFTIWQPSKKYWGPTTDIAHEIFKIRVATRGRGAYPFLEFSVMLIIFVSNLGPLSVISYLMMTITIERLTEMYMMYAMPWKCGSNQIIMIRRHFSNKFN